MHFSLGLWIRHTALIASLPFLWQRLSFVRDYESLPDKLPTDQIAALFVELVDMPVTDLQLTMEAFLQLADRQWHSYLPLTPEIHQRVDQWLIDHWCDDSLDFAETATSLVAHLGLPVSWEHIQTLVCHPDLAIAKVHHDFVSEMNSANPLDPWSGLRKK